MITAVGDVAVLQSCIGRLSQNRRQERTLYLPYLSLSLDRHLRYSLIPFLHILSFLPHSRRLLAKQPRQNHLSPRHFRLCAITLPTSLTKAAMSTYPRNSMMLVKRRQTPTVICRAAVNTGVKHSVFLFAGTSSSCWPRSVLVYLDTATRIYFSTRIVHSTRSSHRKSRRRT